MKFVQRILVSIALFIFLSFTSGWAETGPIGRVDGINPDHAYVVRLVSGVLQDAHLYLWSVDTNTNDPLSSQTDFRSHLLPYRARFRFHVEGTSLIVTMEDLQSPGKNGTLGSITDISKCGRREARCANGRATDQSESEAGLRIYP